MSKKYKPRLWSPARTYEPDLSLSAETHEKIAEIERGGATQQRGFIVGATAARTYEQGIEDAAKVADAAFLDDQRKEQQYRDSARDEGSTSGQEVDLDYAVSYARRASQSRAIAAAIRALGTKDPKGPI